MEDRLLLLGLKAGNLKALQRIYDKYFIVMHTLATGLVRDRAGAEDVVQDVFANLIEMAGKKAQISSLKSYLMTATANRARNLLRARKNSLGCLADTEIAASIEEPSEELARNEEIAKLTKALGELPYEQRETILLHLKGGLKFREIAQCLNESHNTVQSRYRYGLEKLRSILKEKVQE